MICILNKNRTKIFSKILINVHILHSKREKKSNSNFEE